MLSSLFRSRSKHHLKQATWSSRLAGSALNDRDQEEQQQYFTEQEYFDGSVADDVDNEDDDVVEYEEVPEEDEDVNEDDEAGPLLPIFSAALLGKIDSKRLRIR